MDEKTESLKETFDRLKLIISENLEVDIELIKLDSCVVYDLGADEMDKVELVMAIEEQFNVEISDSDVELFTTVNNFLGYLYFNDLNVAQSEIQKIIDREITEIKRQEEIEIKRQEEVRNREIKRQEEVRNREIKRQEEVEIKRKIIKIINFMDNSPIEKQKILEIIENNDFINYEKKIINFFNILNQPRTSPTEIIKFVDILNNHFFVNNLEDIRKILSFLDTSSIPREQFSQLICDDQITSHLNKIKQMKDLIKQKSIEIQNKETEKQTLQNKITTLRDQLYSLEQELKSLYTE